MSGFDERWQEIRRIWAAKENIWLYALVGFFTGILVSPFINSHADLFSNLFPEAIGILFTVAVIDRLNEIRADRQLREQLTRQMASHDNGLALQAVWELIAHGWDKDGSLRGHYFTSANLRDATLLGADLQSTFFTGANFNAASFPRANLSKAHLQFASFHGAHFWYADLQGVVGSYADFRNAEFRGANLRGAHLHNGNFVNANFAGADLRATDLDKANLQGVIFFETDLNEELEDEEFIALLDENTVLPDGNRYRVNLGLEQLDRFTRPKPDAASFIIPFDD